jgi:hypothetical protein
VKISISRRRRRCTAATTRLYRLGQPTRNDDGNRLTHSSNGLLWIDIDIA